MANPVSRDVSHGALEALAYTVPVMVGAALGATYGKLWHRDGYAEGEEPSAKVAVKATLNGLFLGGLAGMALSAAVGGYLSSRGS